MDLFCYFFNYSLSINIFVVVGFLGEFLFLFSERDIKMPVYC